ncbi:hypothetical protein [Staphylospora marina]|uniref:hypothetical protein n=1 Tax=Staphylospora marina TaxID=2490858 RepID=UPI000F5BB0A7|nr:hypothetical protein [Staphylospora marina]
MDGWIRDYRQELESDIWLMPPLYHRVWQWIKYNVNHEGRLIPLKDGSKQKVERGQHMTSIRQIAKGVGWYEGRKWVEPNPKTIRSILKWMEQQEMITVTAFRGNNGYTLITVVNWEVYQPKNDQGNIKHPFEKQRTDINKNVFNDDDDYWTSLADSEPTEDEIKAQRIERYYQKKKGRIGPLSPVDYDEIDKLVKKKIPLEDIFNAIDYAFEIKKGMVNSFSYCATIVWNRLREREMAAERRNKTANQSGQQTRSRSYWEEQKRREEEIAQKRAEQMEYEMKVNLFIRETGLHPMKYGHLLQEWLDSGAKPADLQKYKNVSNGE